MAPAMGTIFERDDSNTDAPTITTSNWQAAVGAIIGGGVAAILLVWVVVWSFKRRTRGNRARQNGTHPAAAARTQHANRSVVGLPKYEPGIPPPSYAPPPAKEAVTEGQENSEEAVQSEPAHEEQEIVSRRPSGEGQHETA